MRRLPPLLLVFGCMLAFALAVPCQADDTQAAQAAWTATLVKMTFQGADYERLEEFVESDPNLVYATLRDGWPRIQNVLVRQFLIQLLVNGVGLRPAAGGRDDGYTPNPHLLDILALGLTDPAAQVRSAATQALGGIAFREIRSLEQLQEWRKEADSGTLAQQMERACRASLAQLESPAMDERAVAYRRLLQVTFHSGRYTATTHGVTVHGLSVGGLCALQRQAALDAGLIAIVARGLKPENPPLIRDLALRLIAHFVPDDAALAKLSPDIQREVPPALDRPDFGEIYDLLGQIRARWVTDLLLQRIAEVDASHAFMSYLPASALGNAGDPRGIPSLIALYDAANPTEYLGQVIERGLCMLTNVPYQFNSGHDGDWWRDWWQEHKQAFPAEARSMPYPRIAGIRRPVGFSLRRHAERRTVATGDYWLVSPGIVSAASEHVLPGLIVVLAGATDSLALCKSWEVTAGRAWDGRYLLAIVPRPAAATPADPARSGSASTRFCSRGFPDGRGDRVAASQPASVRELVADAVRDAESRTPIDPRRVYLLGEGAAGMKVYACSLAKSTPFHGFLLLSSPFRSAQLPALTGAKGRRYCLLHARADRTAPYVLAQAAETLLTQHGASVHLTPMDGATDTRTAALRQAIHWLEAAKN